MKSFNKLSEDIEQRKLDLMQRQKEQDMARKDEQRRKEEREKEKAELKKEIKDELIDELEL